jgi:hypothetical protein
VKTFVVLFTSFLEVITPLKVSEGKMSFAIVMLFTMERATFEWVYGAIPD